MNRMLTLYKSCQNSHEVIKEAVRQLYKDAKLDPYFLVFSVEYNELINSLTDHIVTDKDLNYRIYETSYRILDFLEIKATYAINILHLFLYDIITTKDMDLTLYELQEYINSIDMFLELETVKLCEVIFETKGKLIRPVNLQVFK